MVDPIRTVAPYPAIPEQTVRWHESRFLKTSPNARITLHALGFTKLRGRPGSRMGSGGDHDFKGGRDGPKRRRHTIANRTP